MVDRLDRLAATIKALEEKLQPIVKPSVDPTRPGWREHVHWQARNERAAVDRAEVRDQAEAVLAEAVDLYLSETDTERAAIRALFRTCECFAWAAPLPGDPSTERVFRIHLVVFSIRDQGRDWRDAILWIDGLCATAQKAGLPVADTLIEVAALSSDEVRFEQFRMGRSTRKVLLDYAERYTARGIPVRP